MLKGHRCMQAGHWKEKLRSLAQVEQIPAKQLLTNERVWQRIFEVCVTRSFCKNFTHLGSRALKKNFSSVEFSQDRPLFHWGKMRRCFDSILAVSFKLRRNFAVKKRFLKNRPTHFSSRRRDEVARLVSLTVFLHPIVCR